MDMDPIMGYDHSVAPPLSHQSSVSSVHNSQHSGIVNIGVVFFLRLKTEFVK